ncbi:MAG: hypothetical protein U5K76_06620 [Woeseiaceae bacterium]|nr:hypothetical protein [Woeseiaceae bacterium]
MMPDIHIHSVPSSAMPIPRTTPHGVDGGDRDKCQHDRRADDPDVEHPDRHLVARCCAADRGRPLHGPDRAQDQRQGHRDAHNGAADQHADAQRPVEEQPQLVRIADCGAGLAHRETVRQGQHRRQEPVRHEAANNECNPATPGDKAGADRQQ